MLRTSIAVAAALGATCVLAACGPVRMGAAAIVGSQRISATTLSNEVANLEQAYQANKARIQLQFPLAQAPQQVLAWLLRFKVIDRMAVRNHVRVSNGQSQRALQPIRAQAGPVGPPETPVNPAPRLFPLGSAVVVPSAGSVVHRAPPSVDTST